MKTKSIKTFVARLKRLIAAYAKIENRRERMDWKLVIADKDMQAEANRISGEIMRTERQIIQSLLKEEK